MKQSMRAKRMAGHHRRMHQTSRLNLVSLMDIFTILVFFLMVNSSDVKVLESGKSIKLPESVAEKTPKDTLVVMLSDKDLIVQGRKVLDVSVIGEREADTITELEKELHYQASRRPAMTEAEKSKGRAVTIMGDEKTPYSILKKVMATCASADYRNISLAVSRIPAKGAGSGQEG
jgi:biopolymer transport protein ExbD